MKSSIYLQLLFFVLYYVICFHALIVGQKGWISYLAHSNDLESWGLSPYNPILEVEAGEGKNNSNMDILE